MAARRTHVCAKEEVGLGEATKADKALDMVALSCSCIFPPLDPLHAVVVVKVRTRQRPRRRDGRLPSSPLVRDQQCEEGAITVTVAAPPK